MKVVKYEPQADRKSLIAYFAISIPEWDMIIERCCEFSKDGKRWVSLPSFSVEEGDKRYFVPYVRFGQTTAEKFLKAAREELDKFLAERNKVEF